MPQWVIRYDLRAPDIAPPAPELYSAALEQCAWADERGCAEVIISEHHMSADGYLPSAMVFAAAAAARTQHMRIRISAIPLTLRDPVQAAEDVVIVDNLSNGRLEVILVAGYVPEEFDLFGVDFNRRAQLFEEKVELYARAVSGEPFERDGKTVQVTPPPVQRPRPPFWLGGATPRAARRAALMADGYMPAVPDPALYELYLAERERLGKDPGTLRRPSGPLFVHVAEDPDAVWPRIAPHALHEMNSYARWASNAPGANPYVPIEDADMLRTQGLYAVVTPEECVTLAENTEEGAALILHPLMGGLPPALAWESLELFAAKVLPRISS